MPPRPPRIHSEGSRPERAKAKRVASAQTRCHLGPRGFTPSEADESERKRSESRALKLERSNTSAERSEAREDDARRSCAFRVASPLVMATRRSCGEWTNFRLARRMCSQGTPLPPASQGGSATRHDRRLRNRLLRLRCAPPSETPSLTHALLRSRRGRPPEVFFAAPVTFDCVDFACVEFFRSPFNR